MDQKFLENIDNYFSEYATAQHIPGAIYAIITNGNYPGAEPINHIKAVGYADLENKISVNANTRFRIASMTKSFVGLSILILRERGKLNLSDKLTKYVDCNIKKATQDSPDITIEHLLNMYCGLPQDDPWADRLMGMSEEEFDGIYI
jgi:CubicO group peptidase (beta-lactamase class C family)